MSIARALFIAHGYAATSTTEIVSKAKLTRGALYHHFADKRDLFQAVVEEEARQVALAIGATSSEDTPVARLIAGGAVYLDAMAEPGRSRLMLVEAPVVLGRQELEAIDARHGLRTLRDGLDAVSSTLGYTLPTEPLALILGAAFDRAALAVSDGAAAADYHAVMEGIVRGLCRPDDR